MSLSRFDQQSGMPFNLVSGVRPDAATLFKIVNLTKSDPTGVCQITEI